MKRFVLACTLAAASIFSAMPSQAASVTITTDDARPTYRHAERPYYRHHMRPRHVSQDCFTRTEKIRRHGHTLVKETRICR
ncbi:hypothetical protein HFO63_27060 [Rhizobium laguerreae]|uniref:Uncharacterized protein n=1 Tax=Rhizobium laguerreae TaxID=1076926 RepID=A0AB35FGT9_9HYPH|nr:MULTISPECIES: hypothetical protein [Rhizobium]MBY3064923.1 hypothetical protein [Rhizobium laguerreae]MBY3079245.1 hypothetical protein [Rhizobium laguerreae]MBY3087646.1 hypothetical protein [Rhizobium laguerreae]MBY3112851.1 hypothetical protein [Rhizobium laguerreae]MBY3139346.1 hypothetical protein [Rhizobium laguerreae]